MSIDRTNVIAVESFGSNVRFTISQLCRPPKLSTLTIILAATTTSSTSTIQQRDKLLPFLLRSVSTRILPQRDQIQSEKELSMKRRHPKQRHLMRPWQVQLVQLEMKTPRMTKRYQSNRNSQYPEKGEHSVSCSG
jgi:hypothetical protein